MSNVFEDRVSAYPNRYVMTAEDGSTSYIILERADDPITPGTPLNAETFNALYGPHNVQSGFKMYASLNDIGLTVGSETIGEISSKLPDMSILIFAVTESNASIYPTSNGIVTVKRTSSSRISFEFVATNGMSYNGFYGIAVGGNTWTDWLANAADAPIAPASVE